jgi:hypothetical protein
MGYKGKSDKEYQREYYLKNKKEYQRQYYLRNINTTSSIRAEYYRNKVKERNKNENNVVIVSKEIIISIIED